VLQAHVQGAAARCRPAGALRRARAAGGVQCVQRCCEKFMKHSARVGMRFAELSSEAEQQMQKMAGR